MNDATITLLVSPGDYSQDVLVAERERITAIISGNISRIASLLADDLIHIHATGRIETKDQYVEGLRTRLDFIEIERGELTVRQTGGTAIMTGTIDQRFTLRESGEERRMQAVVTQVWIDRGSGAGWQLASFHACHAS